MSGRPLLALDTSTTVGSVAVGVGDELLAEMVVGVRVRHAESLLPAVDTVLRAAALEPRDLGGVVVAAGPGSFTGVRIAGAAAKGLARALEAPLFAYSALAAVAAGVARSDRAVCALFDARLDEVYAATYRFPHAHGMDVLREPSAVSLRALLEEEAGRDVIYAGEGAVKHGASIHAAGGEVVPAHLGRPRASVLLWLAHIAPELGRVAEPATWEPDYLRPSGAKPPGEGR